MVSESGLGPGGSEMNLERFKEIVEAYGAVPERWPALERQSAIAFVAETPEAQAILDKERHLDDLLRSDRDITPSVGLRESILADAAAIVPTAQDAEPAIGKQADWLSGVRRLLADLDGMDWSLKGWVQPGAVLACAALAGLVTGTYLPGGGVSETLYTLEDEDILNVAFGQADFDLEGWTLNGGGQ